MKAIRGKKTDKRDAKWIADIFKHDLVSGSFIPPADIRQLRDMVRYRRKLTNFTTGEKNRAQNCLTVSNFKLDDVFSDVFGKAASAITTKILENPAERITDISSFRTKGMKATDEQILAAVDREMCAEQAEKLRIIRSHMDNLKLCKANLESLILSTAEKYLPQLNLVMTVPGIQSFAAIGIISKIGVDMSVFPTSKHLCSWAGLRRRTARAPGRRKPPESAEPGPTSNRCSCSVRTMQFAQKIPRNPKLLPYSQIAPGPQKGYYFHRQNAVDSHLQHSQKERALQTRTLPQHRPPSEEPRGFCGRSRLHPPTARLFGDCSSYRLDFKHNFVFCPLSVGLVLCALLRNCA